MPMPQVNSPATNVDWLTPLSLIQSLGEFDLDPCCPEVMPWETAKTMIRRPDDGLAHTWSDYGEGRVWLNPPFRGAGEWIRRLRDHGNGIALLPCATDTGYFAENVWTCAHGVLFLRGRINFCRHDGTVTKVSINRPCCLVAYGARNLAALMDSGLEGALVTEIRK